MSLSFRLKYMLGLIPSAQKLDAAWDNLITMRDNLAKIELSPELARYNELKSLVESTEFQHKKRDVLRLDFKSSAEKRLLDDLKAIEHQKSMKQYLQLASSSDFVRFKQLDGSEKITKYQELKKLVDSPEFAKRKKEIDAIDYKSSAEYQLHQEYTALKESDKLKLYYKTIASSDYLVFMEVEPLKGQGKIEASDPRMKVYERFLKSKEYENLKAIEQEKLADRFEELKLRVSSKEFTEREAFLKNAKRYETTPDYARVQEVKGLETNSDISFFAKFSESAAYKTYEQMKDSKEIRRHDELVAETSTESFKNRVAFLKDKKRYLKTAEYQLEQEFKQLQHSKTIQDYQQLHKAKELHFFDRWQIVFEDNFSDKQIDGDKWSQGNFWAAKTNGKSFSQEGELQGFSAAATQVHHNTLTILSSKQKVEGLRWKSMTGLVPTHFDYTSGMINTGESFRIEKGIIEVKARFALDASITNAISLTSDKPFPQIDLFRSGKSGVGMGIVDKEGIGKSGSYTHFSAIQSNEYYIYRLELSGSELIWKINETEVFRHKFISANEGYFFNLLSSLHGQVNELILPHRFEIDWIRCFGAKN